MCSRTNGKYRAQVMEDGKKRHLGTFATPEEAALCHALQSGKCATKDSRRGKKRQREQRDEHEQQPASSCQGAEHTPPQLTGDVETVVIGEFTFRCCASSRESIFRPAVEGRTAGGGGVERAGDV